MLEAITQYWFHGIDVVIDFLSALVLILLFSASLEYYRISRKRLHLHLSMAFCLITVGFLARVLMNAALYSSEFTFFSWLVAVAQAPAELLFVSLVHRVCILLGVFLIYTLYYENSAQTNWVLASLLVTSMLLSSSKYFVFHLFSLLFLSLIAWHFVRQDLQRSPRALLAYGFSFLAVSQLLFIFIGLSGWFYIFGEFVQLLGYASLLAMFVLVRQHAKKG